MKPTGDPRVDWGAPRGTSAGRSAAHQGPVPAGPIGRVPTASAVVRGAGGFEYRQKPVYEAVTRLINVTAALVGLVCLAPLLLAIALAIKLSDRRAPVFYRGRRVGKGGRPYTIFKFRTMVPHAEQRIGGRLIDRDSSDITPIGRLLRRRKLDELPQLLNVLRGEMNLVGPRPAREVFLEELRQRVKGYDRRFLVKPGITGLAQVRGGYYTDPRNKLRYELVYIQRRSVWLDLKLIAVTQVIMASRVLTMFGLLFWLLAFVIFVPTTFLPGLRVNLLGLRLNIAFVLIACLGAAWVGRSLFGRGLVLRRTPADKYIVGFIVWAILGAVLNPGILQNLLGVLYISSSAFALYFLATQSVERDVRKIHRYMQWLGVITIVVSVRGILEYIVGAGAEDGELRAASMLGDPNVLALYLAMALPVLLYLWVSSDRRRSGLVWAGGALLAAACVALTFSRSGYIAFLVTTLAFLARSHRRLFYGALLACVLLLGIAEVSESPRFSPRQVAASPHGLHMLQLYASVLNESDDEMLLGTGWRRWKTGLSDAAFNRKDMSDIPTQVVSLPRTLKNMYLTLLVEHGVVGLLLMLLIFVTVLETIYRGSRRVSEESLQLLLWAIFSSGLGFVVNMVFFDSFYFIAVAAMFWLLLGLGTGISLEFGSRSPQRYRVLQFHH